MVRNLFFKWGIGSGALLSLLFGLAASAQEVYQELQETVRAEVIEVVDEYERDIVGTNATALVQDVRVELLEGEKEGTVARFETDILPLEVGDVIYVNRNVTIAGTEYFTFKDAERRMPLVWLVAMFILCLGVFAGWQGLRALVSLLISVAAIMLLLVPALLAGYSPAVVSLGVAGLVLALVLFLTHGINPRSLVAFLGTMTAVMVTCAVAAIWVDWMRLTGFGSDASVYLNFATGGSLDFAGLLLGSIIIGILGVLDDVSITQASVVQELRYANTELGFVELYRRAIRVGRDHVGSLVNTLALAYVGVSLPLVLLYAKSNASVWASLNQEVIAAELLRIIVGSLGLILAVPITTVFAAWYFKDKSVDQLSHLSSGHHHHH